MPELVPRYNIAPTQQVPIVRVTAGSPHRSLSLARWGLIPSWAKDPSIGNRLINARSETVAEKPSFRSAFKRQRCLVAADGYYEWKKTGAAKQPYHIRLQDGQVFGFAGLWESWSGPRDAPLEQPLETCTIITTAANDFTRQIHDRMPVILRPDDYELWLDPELQEPAPLLPLLRALESDEMVANPVSTFVNRPANDSPRCIEIQKEPGAGNREPNPGPTRGE
jgi:putative SOS response-associated peptidase YedK